ncbi:MAG: ATP-binding protein [Sandaracinaceae bacterium]
MAAAIALSISISIARTPAAALDPDRAPSQYAHARWDDRGGLPQNSVFAIAEGADGRLWFGTENGIVSFDGAGFVVYDRDSVAGLVSDLGGALWLEDDRVWAGGLGTVCAIDPDAFEARCTSDGLGNGRVRGLVRIEGRLVVGTTDGLFEVALDAPTRTLARGMVHAMAIADGALLVASDAGLERRRGERVERLIDGPVTALAVDAPATIWAASPRGVERSRGGPFARVVAGPIDGVRALHRDGDGQLWVAHRHGLSRVVDGALELALPAERALSVYEDREGNLFCGTAYEGLHRLRDSLFVPLGREEGLSTDVVLNVAAAPDAELWLALTDGHIARVRDGRLRDEIGPDEGLDGAVVAAMRFADDLALVATSRAVYAVDRASAQARRLGDVPDAAALELDERGDLWIGSSTQGVVRWPRARWADPERREDEPGDGERRFGIDEGLPGLAVTRIRRTGRELFVATTAGLARLDGTRFVIVEPTRGRDVSDVLRDADGTLWVSAQRDGLARIDPDGTLYRLDGPTGLGRGGFHDVHDDGRGSLWMSSNRGVTRVSRDAIDAYVRGDANELTHARFGTEHGMRSAECNGPGGTTDARGVLHFATIRGAVRVDPRVAARAPSRPGLAIAALAADGAPIDARVPADAERLRAVIRAVALGDGERLRFRYRLSGLDRTWIELGDAREVRLGAPPPGRYRLIVEASRDEPGARRAHVERAFEVEAHVWERPLYQALFALLALLALFAVYRARLAQLRARQRQLEAIVEARTASLKEAQTELVKAERAAQVATIAEGIAHELNNPINFMAGNVPPLRGYVRHLIAAAKALSRGEAKTPDEARALLAYGAKKRDLDWLERDLESALGDLEEGSRRAKLIVADLASLTAGARRGLTEVDLAKVIEQTERIAAPRLEGLDARFDAEGAPVISAREGLLEQAVLNLVDNAARALDGRGAIEVVARRDGEHAVITVRDDGRGMPEEVRARAVEPFFTTRPAGEGSGLGLAIVASNVRQHGGELTIESAPGEGTTVTLRLPIRRSD